MNAEQVFDPLVTWDILEDLLAEEKLVLVLED